MPWNGSGVYSVPYNWTNDAANGIKILASRQDGQWSDLVTAMNNVICRDGQATITANLPMSTFRFTNVGNGAALTDYLAVGQLKNGSIIYAGTAGGTVDALTGTTSPVNTALTNGMTVIVKAAGANTITAPTFVLDSIGSALTITKTGGVALVAGDIVGAGHMLQLVYSSTGTRWELLNPALSTASTGTGALVRANAPTLTGTLTGADAAFVPGSAAFLISKNSTYSTSNSGGLYVRNASTTTKAVSFGYDSSADFGYVQSRNETIAVEPLALNPDGGAVILGSQQLNAGYLEIPIVGGAAKTSSYPAVLADSGETILMNGTSVTATIPANGSVAYKNGTTLTFININSTSLAIAITSDTMTLANSTSTGTRTLAQNGIATAVKMTSTTWLISGNGLS